MASKTTKAASVDLVLNVNAKAAAAYSELAARVTAIENRMRTAEKGKPVVRIRANTRKF